MDLLQIKLRKIIDILTRRLEIVYRERCEIMVEDTFPSHDIKFTISIPKINTRMVQVYPNAFWVNPIRVTVLPFWSLYVEYLIRGVVGTIYPFSSVVLFASISM